MARTISDGSSCGTIGQLTPTAARAIAQRFAPRSMHAFAHRQRALGESPQPGSMEWERANLWKTGLFVGGLFVVIVAGAFLFLGAPKPYYSGRRSLVSTPPSARR